MSADFQQFTGDAAQSQGDGAAADRAVFDDLLLRLAGIDQEFDPFAAVGTVDEGGGEQIHGCLARVRSAHIQT